MVNILAEDQAELATAFARSVGPSAWAGGTRPGETAILPGACQWCENPEIDACP
ncbi:hypothetical protein [Streptomyces himastatinicus]|uniref:hypothetical protein n=1 Tax=Streptomyces himastatinicus TaxID=998084 RepID=UPI0001B4DF03|nr:hypothetical protein [Streptomyces himastatinicus]